MPFAELDLHQKMVEAVIVDEAGRLLHTERFPATRAIASAKIKTDRVDATVLAQLLRLDYLPRVWQPDAATQALRRHTPARANLVADRTRIKNRIHAVLHQRPIQAPQGDLFGACNLKWLAALKLDDHDRQSLDRHLRQLAAVQAELARLEERLLGQAYHDPRANS